MNEKAITDIYTIQVAAQEGSPEFCAGASLQPGVRPPTPIHLDMFCCGASFYFPTTQSFPKKSLPCPCGKRGRWVVFYEESTLGVRCV